MIPELEIVELTCDLPEHGLKRGDSGTIVFVFPPDAYMVEFMTYEGETVAVIDVSAHQVRLAAPEQLQHLQFAEAPRS